MSLRELYELRAKRSFDRKMIMEELFFFDQSVVAVRGKGKKMNKMINVFFCVCLCLFRKMEIKAGGFFGSSLSFDTCSILDATFRLPRLFWF